MNNYNFSTLHDKELGLLSRDLLNVELKLDLQNFKSGKDKGIDLRYAPKKNLNQIAV